MKTAFIDDLSEILKGRVAVMGVGSESRGDDIAGSCIGRSLKTSDDFFAIDCGDIPENYTGPIKEFRPERVIFIDAVDFGGEAGEVAFIDAASLQEKRFNTHRPSLRVVMDYLKNETGCKISLIGIQPGSTLPGSGVTPAVQHTIKVIKKAIIELVDLRSDEGENS